MSIITILTSDLMLKTGPKKRKVLWEAQRENNFNFMQPHANKMCPSFQF